MKNEQKGAASTAVIVIVVLIIAGIIAAYYWNRTPATTEINSGAESQVPTNTSGTSGQSTDQTVLTPLNTGSTVTTSTVTSSNVFPGGTQYASPYGLTLAFPATWQAYGVAQTTPSYGDVSPTTALTFTLPDGPVLRINVFTKEQWNRLKTEENAANQNVNSLGEGEYLGENSTYIYSYTILGHQAEAQQVLNNVIRF